MLRTTALVSLLPLLATVQPASAEFILNNGSQSLTNPSAASGTWSAASWYDTNTATNVAWPGAGIAVLGEIDSNVSPSGTADLNVDGNFQVDEIRVEQNGYTLSGAGSLRGTGSGLIFRGGAPGVSLDVSTQLQNAVQIQDGLTLNYSGTATGMTNLFVSTGSVLNTTTTATTFGSLNNQGEVNLAGQHSGAVQNSGTLTLTGGGIDAGPGGIVQNDGNLSGQGTIIGSIQNTASGTITLDSAGGAGLSVSAGIDNLGRLNLNDGSVLQGDIRNADNLLAPGVINLGGATVTGNITNDGNLLVHDSNAVINGNVNNTMSGNITTGNNQNQTLTINGRLTTAGDIYTNGPRDLTINAAEILLLNPGGIETGAVHLTGLEVVQGDRSYSSDETLSAGPIDGGLLHEGNGTITVTASLDGSDYEIRNLANFLITGASGSVYNLGTFNNTGPDADLTVNLRGTLFADVLNNTGTVNNVSTIGATVNNNAGGTFTNNGLVIGNVANAAGATLNSTREIRGDLDNAGTADLSGIIAGLFHNSGTDVNVTGDLSVGTLNNTGTLSVDALAELSSNTEIDNSGTMNVTGTVAADLANTGTLNSTGTIDGDLDNDGTANLAGTITGNLDNSTANLTVTGDLGVGSLTNRNTGTVTVDANTTLNSTGQVNNAGTLSVQGQGTLAGNVSNSGQMSNSGTLTGNVANLAGGTLNSQGLIDGNVDNDGTANLAGTITGALDNSSANLTVTGNLSVDSLDNSGSLTVDGAHTLNSGGVVDNTGTMNVNGTMTSTGAFGNNGTLNVAGALNANGGLTNSEVLNVSGAINGNVTNADQLNLTGGTITGTVINNSLTNVSGSSSIVGDLTNNGQITGTGGASALSVTGGTFLNNGILNAASGSSLTITADEIEFGTNSNVAITGVVLNGNIVNRGDLTYDSASSLSGGGLVNKSTGNVIVSDILDAAGHNITNEGEFLVTTDPNSAGNLTNVGALENLGSFTIASGGTVSAQSVKNTAGTMTIAGQMNAPLTNTAGATVALDNGTLNGALNNGGLLTGSGTVNGALNNTGQIRVDAGETISATSQIDNGGTVSVAGTLDAGLLNRAGASTTLGGGTITGDVSNAGSLTGNGTISGGLINSGTADLGGQAGATQNSGTLSTNGNLTLASVANTGTLRVDSGDTLSSAVTVDNRSRLEVEGTLAAGLTNDAAAATVLAGGTINGAVQNAGSLTGNGAILSTLTNTGTASLSGRLSTTNNSGTLQTSGNLSVANLTNTGTTRVLAGDTLSSANEVQNQNLLVVAGTVAATVDNSASATVSMTGGTVQGDVRNSGQLTGSGQITGTLANGGSTRILAGQSLTAGNTINTNSLVIAGELASNVQNRANASTELNGGTIRGNVTNDGTLAGTGRITGTVTNNSSLTSTGRLDLGGLINNSTLDVATGSTLGTATAARNNSTFNIAGTLDGALLNSAAGTVALNGGTVTGRLSNSGALSGTGNLAGGLSNLADGTVTIQRGETLTSAAGVENDGRITVAGILDGALVNNRTLVLSGGRITGPVANTAGLSGSGTIAGVLSNSGLVRVDGGQTLISAAGTLNTGRITVAGRLQGNLVNEAAGSAQLSGGTMAGTIDNRGTLSGEGTVDGKLVNRVGGAVGISGTVTGDLVNLGGTVTTVGELVVNGTVDNAPAGTVLNARGALAPAASGALIDVTTGSTLTAKGRVTNWAGATLNVDGRLIGDVTNAGAYFQTGRLDGSLTTTGAADLAGIVTGNVDYADGTLKLADGTSINGTLTLRQDHVIAEGSTINAARTVVGPSARLSLGGTLAGAVHNTGTLALADRAGKVAGNLQNDGMIDLRDGGTASVLTVAGLSGTGTAMVDISTGDALGSDRIVVSGGATTGKLHFGFNNLSGRVGSIVGKRVTLLDVDESFGAGNDFDFSADQITTASERIVYSIDQTGEHGDLSLVSQVNPAIGAMFANVTLVQSLIGAVINRPTSPYVTGLVVDSSAKPCGTGGWGRATGGHAKVNGKTDNQVSILENEVSANYYGMQGGLDMACFDDRFGGWDMAFGALGGVNTGDSRQPIHVVNGGNALAGTDTLASITTTDFQQRYLGVYATASKDRWVADLQVRVERTDFELKNKPIVGSGLGITDPDFSSDGVTVSGSVSYTMPLAQTGWNFTPTVGFAWSKYSTDSIRFEDDFRMEFDDSDRKIGFLGATVSKSFIRMEENAAIQTFATATYYKDFADDAVSRLYNDSLPGYETQVMTSENLKSYGEISLGANYVKVLDPGRAGGARQFSTSARIDGRFGDAIDSVGVTGQVRWQF